LKWDKQLLQDVTFEFINDQKRLPPRKGLFSEEKLPQTYPEIPHIPGPDSPLKCLEPVKIICVYQGL